MRNTLCTAALFSNTTTIYLRYSIYMYRVRKIFTKYIYFFLFTAYCMVFAALYIDIRMSLCKNLQLFKPFVQFVFILLAILCGLSRVSDYKHHGSDVLAGLILGTLMAMFFIYKVLQLRHVDVQENENAHSIQTNTDKNELEQGEV